MCVKGGGWCQRNGKRVKVNLFSCNKNNGSGILIFDNEWTILFCENPHFLEKKPFVLLFAFLSVDLEFSFLPLKYFIHLSIEAFVQELWPKFMLAKKLIFPHSQNFFSICKVSTFKVYAEGKSFTNYSLIIIAEIHIIFRSKLTW